MQSLPSVAHGGSQNQLLLVWQPFRDEDGEEERPQDPRVETRRDEVTLRARRKDYFVCHVALRHVDALVEKADSVGNEQMRQHAARCRVESRRLPRPSSASSGLRRRRLLGERDAYRCVVNEPNVPRGQLLGCTLLGRRRGAANRVPASASAWRQRSR